MYIITLPHMYVGYCGGHIEPCIPHAMCMCIQRSVYLCVIEKKKAVLIYNLLFFKGRVPRDK